MEPPRVPGGIQEKVTTNSWITVGHPQMCLGHPCSWLLESFPCKTCESLQELGPANIFQICTWPPRCSPHSLITFPEQRDPGQRPAPRLPPAPEPRPGGAARAVSGPVTQTRCYVSPGLNVGKLPFSLSSRFSSITQTASCGGSGVYTSRSEQRV